MPLHDERALFEFLSLEGAQAGLSWITVLRKRDNYRKAFDNFEPARVAQYGEQDFERLMNDAGIVRNRLKIKATIENARAFLRVQGEFGSFDKYIWGFVNGKPIVNHWTTLRDIPPKTPLSETISKDLLKRGFRFVGPTIVYAHMQATGMVNDHLESCFCYKRVGR